MTDEEIFSKDLDEEIYQLGMLMRSTPPKGCFEEVLREMAKDDENVFTAVADILFSLPPKKAIEQIKKWRHI